MLEVAARLDGYDTRQCITALRKIWYNDDRRPVKTVFGWSILIPGASSTPLPPRWGQDNLAKIVEHARRSAQVRNVEGGAVDVGHLFAGLDAGNYPTSVQIAGGLVKMRSNKEAATFVGDLGSVVAEYIHRSKSSMYDTANIKQETLLDLTYAEFASDADMNGNADAYACRILPKELVCDALDAYYAPGDTGVSRRYAKLKEYLKDTNNAQEEVFNAALAYAVSKKWIADVGLVLKEPGPGFLTPTYWDLYWNVSGWVCDYFLGRVSKLAEGVD
jgi:predicted transcriptional regulator